MPPSPALKCSPRREIKSDRKHRRGCSFDSGISLKAKDDDLTLFNEMQMREREEFLLRSNDDFEDSLSKLKCLSDYKLDINIPIRGENNDLLNADSRKNDYDWLLTPPDTPLFPSLDDDEPPPTNLLTRSRVVGNQGTARSSASPHRRSPSPRPGSSTLQLRGRASLAPYSAPSPAVSSSATSSRRPSPSRKSSPSRRPSTPSSKPSTSAASSRRPSPSRKSSPSRRPSTPSSKPSTPTPRSVSPALRRLSSSPSGWASSSVIKGTSPIKGTRGGSVSPKLRGWQSNVPGFSSDAPPNLRTSVYERPASYSRGSSPASRNGKESYSRHGRESISPTASRSVSSWHSHDRDHFSYHSKGSIASSGDDDVDSLQSVSTVGISVSPSAVKNEAFIHNRTMSHSKRASRTPLPSSALRHMDHRKTPQNMFRPLMSSVPPSSFFGGKGSTQHRPIFSRNLSLATRSTVSCDLVANVTPNIEDIDRDHAYLDPEMVKVFRMDSCLNEEMSIFDKMEGIGVDAKRPEQFSIHDGVDVRTRKEIELECQNSIPDLCGTVPDTSYKRLFVVDHPVLDSDERISICSICGKSFQTEKTDSGDAELCQQCAFKDNLSREVSVKISQLSEEDSHSKMVHAVDVASGRPYLKVVVLESSEEGKTSLVTQPARKPELSEGTPQEGVVTQLRMIGKESKVDKELDIRQTIESLRSISEYRFKPSTSFSPSSSLRSDGSEGTGISGLLKRSSSTKEAVLQGRAFTASNISCNESSGAKESPSTLQLDSRSSSVASSLDILNAMKASYSRSSSTASSLDLDSSRKAEAQLPKQLSSRKYVTTSPRDDSNFEPHGSVSLSTGDLQTNSQVEENHELLGCYSGKEISSVNDERCRLIDDLDGSTLATTSIDTIGHEHDDYAMGCSVVDVTLSESSICSQNSQNDLASMLHEISENHHTNGENIKMETPVDIPFAVGTSDETTSSDTSTCESSVTRDEIEKIDGLDCSQLNSTELQNPINDMESCHTSASLMSDKNISVSFDELNNTDTHADKSIHVESTVTVENSGQKSRRLTLEEATDTILFCNKIIQDLASKAAGIGAEKEQTFTPEVLRPTVTFLQKPVSEPKTPNRTLTKPASKSQKVNRKSSETENKLLTEPVNDVKVEESHRKQVDHDIDSAKPKCSCILM